ncbi:outer membrane beta-barrel protein [Lewinella sp. LCG006]|uniref:outer membrane beta-barrel protein n=1 Tax=Lewinella sp. LCG006 TaxID=3231911 RepID=UPI00345F7F70
MKNTLATLLFIVSLLTTLSNLHAQMPKWAFGAHSIMGLSGSIRQEAKSLVVNERVYDHLGKEALQLSYGVGLWLERSLNPHWSLYTSTSFQRVKVLANSTFVHDGADLYSYDQVQSSWASQYFQLSLSGRYHFGEDVGSHRWFVGAGIQRCYVYRHNYQSEVTFRYDPGLGPGFAYGVEGLVFTNKYIPHQEPAIERSPIALAGRVELGLRIDRWTMSLVNTAFFQERKTGVPYYSRFLTISDEPNPDGSLTTSGVPLRYVRSSTLHFAYQIK